MYDAVRGRRDGRATAASAPLAVGFAVGSHGNGSESDGGAVRRDHVRRRIDWLIEQWSFEWTSLLRHNTMRHAHRNHVYIRACVLYMYVRMYACMHARCFDVSI